MKKQLYVPRAKRQVMKLPLGQRQDFVAQRESLSVVIRQLSTAAMRDIRTDLQKNSVGLRQGISDLSRSIERVQGIRKWADRIGDVVGMVGKIVDLVA